MHVTVTASVTHFSKGFVADGIDYHDPPDTSCVTGRLLDGRTVPGGAALFFQEDDCWGRPITTYACSSYPGQCDFVATEDGVALGATAQTTVLDRDGVEPFARLLLDVSAGTSGERQQMIDGAKQFVTTLQVDDRLRAHIAIDLFDRSRTVVTWQGSTLDTRTLLGKLDALATYVSADPTGANLYGAVIGSLASLATDEQSFRQRNFGGALTSGYVVLFSQGVDTAGWKSQADALAAISASTDGVVAVGLYGPSYDPVVLGALAPNAVITAQTPGNLSNAFGALGTRIAGEAKRAYMLGYCTASTSKPHTISVSVAGATNRSTVSYAFTPTGYGCSARSFSTSCNGTACGGLGCGACDDRTSACEGATGACVSLCVSANQCGGVKITNANGYEQSCSDEPAWASCNGVCVDTRLDPSNCGACGDACDAAAGELTCGAGHCVSEWATWTMPNHLPAYQGINPPHPEHATVSASGNTVHDDVTGLTWQRDPGAGSYTQAQAVAHCASLDLDGFDDWRLPVTIELLSLWSADAFAPNGYVAFAGSSWAASPVAGDATRGWSVNASSGVSPDDVTHANAARCVRGTSPAITQHYVVQSDTVYDTQTELTWRRDTGQFSGSDSTNAANYCTLLGGGWRLPTLRELETIVDRTRSSPAVDPLAFPGTPYGSTAVFWAIDVQRDTTAPYNCDYGAIRYYCDVPTGVDFTQGVGGVFYVSGVGVRGGAQMRCVR